MSCYIYISFYIYNSFILALHINPAAFVVFPRSYCSVHLFFFFFFCELPSSSKHIWEPVPMLFDSWVIISTVTKLLFLIGMQMSFRKVFQVLRLQEKHGFSFCPLLLFHPGNTLLLRSSRDINTQPNVILEVATKISNITSTKCFLLFWIIFRLIYMDWLKIEYYQTKVKMVNWPGFKSLAGTLKETGLRLGYKAKKKGFLSLFLKIQSSSGRVSGARRRDCSIQQDTCCSLGLKLLSNLFQTIPGYHHCLMSTYTFPFFWGAFPVFPKLDPSPT